MSEIKEHELFSIMNDRNVLQAKKCFSTDMNQIMKKSTLQKSCENRLDIQ